MLGKYNRDVMNNYGNDANFSRCTCKRLEKPLAFLFSIHAAKSAENRVGTTHLICSFSPPRDERANQKSFFSDIITCAWAMNSSLHKDVKFHLYSKL